MDFAISSIVFSLIGTGYLIYGKRQENWTVLGSGVALCVFPYFVSGPFASMMIGGVLIALPWLLRDN